MDETLRDIPAAPAPPAGLFTRSLLRDHILPPAVYFAAFMLLTWPAMRSFSTSFFGAYDDLYQNIWNLWWVDKSITELHQSPYHTTWLHYPRGTTLFGHTLNPFNGLLAIPLRRVMSPQATYNAIILFSFVVCGWTTYALARAVSGSRGGALLAGFLLTFSAFHFAHATCHLQLVALEWVPLCLLCVLRLMHQPTLSRALAAAGAVLLVALCDYYYLLYSAIAGLLLYAVMAREKRDAAFALRRPYVLPLLAFVAASLATTGVLVGMMLIANQRDPFFGSHSATIYYADLLAPFIPGGSWRFRAWTERYWSVFHAGWVEMSVYVGWGTIALAVVAWRQRAVRTAAGGALATNPASFTWWIVTAFVFFVLSLGPELRVWGLHTTIPMPYALLERFVPIFKLSGLPVRMMVMVSLALAVLAACGWAALARSQTSPRRYVMLALLVLIVFETWPRAMPLSATDVPAWVHAMKDMPGSGGVIDTETHPALSLYYQTIHEKPFAFGYISREPSSVATNKLRKRLALRQGDFDALRDVWRIEYVIVAATAPPIPSLELAYADDAVRIYRLRPVTRV